MCINGSSLDVTIIPFLVAFPGCHTRKKNMLYNDKHISVVVLDKCIQKCENKLVQAKSHLSSEQHALIIYR